jgi:chromatin segregation and condensation protein Rec8/ScpA/Scc1 (kleisin family)
MLSKERSFNRLCTLIRVGEDSEETATEINDVLNELYQRYSELKIFRAVASRFSHQREDQSGRYYVKHQALNHRIKQHGDRKLKLISRKVS